MTKDLKELSCRDAGMDCDFLVRCETIEEVVEHAARHSQRAHGYKGFPEKLYLEMRKVVRSVPGTP